MTQPKYKYDVFLSHNSKDKPAVRRFADRLRSVDLNPFLDVDELIPGANWQNELEAALENSRLTAVFVSPNNISPWEEAEMQVALSQQRQDAARRVIPVLLPGKYEPEVPAFLGLNTWVNFRETDIEDDEAFSRLLAGIWGITPREARERFAENADAMPAPEEEDSDPDALPDPGPKGSNWRLPFARNASFTGRAGELRQLGEMLLNEGKQSVVITQSITGMGGIGKTQLAVEFCYRYGNQFDGVYWLDTRNPESIERELYECGWALGLYTKDQVVELDAAINAVLGTWAQGRPLIVLDNLESEAGLQAISDRLSGAGELAVLLTARKQAWPKRLVPHSLPLRAFTKDEAREFLRGELDDSTRYPDTELDALGKRLGYHPLALYLAMHYLRVHALAIPAYLERLTNAISHPSQQAAQWTDDLSSATGYDLNLHHALNLSWDAVKDETARTLFKLAAWCAPNTPILPALLLRALDTEDEAALGKTMNTLANVGLMRAIQNKAGPELHPLLCEYGQLLDDETHSQIGRMAHALGTEIYHANKTGLPAKSAPLQAHLETLAPLAEEHLPEKAAALWNNLGAYLDMIAGYAGAIRHYRQALALLEQKQMSQRPEYAATLNNIGSALQDMGDYPAAVEHYKQALAMDRAAFGEQHPHSAAKLNNIGGALHAMGDFPAAVEHYKQALAIWRSSLGDEHPQVAVGLNNIGGTLQDMGDYPAALEHFRQALEIHENNQMSQHPHYASALNNLGLALQDMGDYPAAIEHYRQALAIWRSSLGDDHPQVAVGLNNIGGSLHVMGDFPAAVEHYKQALAMDRAAFGEQHPSVARDLNNLGRLLGEMGERETACAHLRQALAILEATLPAEHPYITSVKEALVGYGCYEG